MRNLISRKFSLSKIGLAVAAPLVAAVFSIAISSIAVIASKNSPIEAFKTMWDFGTESASLMETINIATPYYIAALAIAVTFRAGLFNIGVEGQLRLVAISARCLCFHQFYT
jgi:simple sugar transport system permease protein